MPVPCGVQRGLVHEGEREGPVQLRENLEGALLKRGGLCLEAEHRGDHRGVRGAAAAQFSSQIRSRELADIGHELRGVREVSVVREGHGTEGRGAEGGLRVLPRTHAGGGVSDVADREVPAQSGKILIVEHLGDQTNILVHKDLLLIRDGDTRSLLASMLERIQPVVHQLADLLTRVHDSEDSTFILWLVLWKELSA